MSVLPYFLNISNGSGTLRVDMNVSSRGELRSLIIRGTPRLGNKHLPKLVERCTRYVPAEQSPRHDHIGCEFG